ncbi:RNA polymerase sigma factor [Calderihabitans maritimus]|uniref:RNA polymerase sigma factor n=1 Tax=Calderihabitans maritimus TaxID=1246530 RepID=UPI000B50B62A|nr:sigma-70 family RNA polymerase sigma factor [Calderihabitans maritimus]
MFLDDDILVGKSKAGDMGAFEELVRRYEKQVFTVAYRFMGNREDAVELAQEAFLRAFTAIKKFRGQSSFKTWLYHIVANVCRDELRKRQRCREYPVEDPAPLNSLNQTIGNSFDPVKAYEDKEGQEYIQKAITSLAPEYRMVLVMREFQGFSYEEIAAQLDCSLGTVKSRLSRARKLLRDKLLRSGNIAQPKAVYQSERREER